MSAGFEAEDFDTSIPGVPETRWADWASEAPEWIPPAAHIVVVAPHPDDETLGAGGLIFTCSHRHTKVTVISLTDGEAACPEVPALAAVRRRELVGAMRELELAQADIFRLGMPDGELARREVELAKSITAWFREPHSRVAIAKIRTLGTTARRRTSAASTE